MCKFKAVSLPTACSYYVLDVEGRTNCTDFLVSFTW